MIDTVHLTMPLNRNAYYYRIQKPFEERDPVDLETPYLQTPRNEIEAILCSCVHLHSWKPDIRPKSKDPNKPPPPATKLFFGPRNLGNQHTEVSGTFTMPNFDTPRYAQIPGGSITFWNSRKSGVQVTVEIELGKVLNRHNGALLSPRACAYALNAYLEFLNYNFRGILDTSRIHLGRLDVFWQWKVDGLRNRFPRLEHHVLSKHSAKEIHRRTGYVGIPVNRDVYVTFYDKSYQMEQKCKERFDDEFLAEPEGFDYSKVWHRMMKGETPTTTEEKAQFKVTKEYLKRVGGPFVYKTPEMKDVLRYEVSLTGNTLRHCGIYDYTHVGDWTMLDAVFDGYRIVETLRKYFRGVFLGPAINAADILLSGNIYAYRSLILHYHPELRDVFYEAKIKRTPGCNDASAEARRQFKEMEMHPVSSFPETLLRVPDFEDMIPGFGETGMFWWQERVTPDGDFLRWQEEGCIKPCPLVPRKEWAGYVRVPRPTMDKNQMPFAVPVCEMDYSAPD